MVLGCCCCSRSGCRCCAANFVLDAVPAADFVADVVFVVSVATVVDVVFPIRMHGIAGKQTSNFPEEINKVVLYCILSVLGFFSSL